MGIGEIYVRFISSAFDSYRVVQFIRTRTTTN